MAEKKWGVKSFNLCSLPHLVITSDASQSCVPLVLSIYPTKSLGFLCTLIRSVTPHHGPHLCLGGCCYFGGGGYR